MGRDHHRIVGRSQQHPPAGDKAELADQHIGDAIHQLLELAIGVTHVGTENAGRVTAALLDPAIEKIDDAVEPRRILQFRPGKDEFRPLIRRRQMIPSEGVDVGGVSLCDVSLGSISHCTLLSPRMTPGNVFRNIILNLKQIGATAESEWSRDFLGSRCGNRVQRASSLRRSVIGDCGSASGAIAVKWLAPGIAANRVATPAPPQTSTILLLCRKYSALSVAPTAVSS